MSGVIIVLGLTSFLLSPGKEKNSVDVGFLLTGSERYVDFYRSIIGKEVVGESLVPDSWSVHGRDTTPHRVRPYSVPTRVCPSIRDTVYTPTFDTLTSPPSTRERLHTTNDPTVSSFSLGSTHPNKLPSLRGSPDGPPVQPRLSRRILSFLVVQ